ncbi:MAG: exonuclease SbcC, partial [Nocardioides sp.]|nr:exonuclease SbcC [Nocardioides sp.]
MNASGDVELTVEDLRAVTAYAVDCATTTLGIATRDLPGDPRPAAAIEAARVFVDGAARSNLQRRAAADAHRAGREAPTEAGSHAATAAGDAAAAAYLHPLPAATQVRHVLGAAAHAARAAELARGDDPVVAEYMLHGAARRMTPAVR